LAWHRWFALARSEQHRLDSQFMNFMDKHDEVMTENLAKGFVDHCSISLGAQTVSKFSLQHTEGGFDVRPLW
jgi:hypothetical protein